MKQTVHVTSRTNLMLVLLAVIFGLFMARLFYLQIIRHGYYENRAYQSQVSKLTISPERGRVFALDGETTVPLVLNQTVYTVFADPKEVDDPAAISSAVKRIAGGTTVDGYESKLRDDSLRYVVMARGISRAQAEKIRDLKLAGVGLQKGSQRTYPEDTLGAQLLGYVDSEGKGQYGFEGAMDAQLKGTPGLLQTVTDVRQIPLTIGSKDAGTPAVNGSDVVLSIDRNVQKQAETVLKKGLDKARATKGSVVVMNPKTGRVMAMANYPSYHPAKYADVQDYRVFQNGIVSDPYEVGSVMKVLSMGVGLNSGAVTPNSTFNNTGSVKIDGTVIKNVEEDPIYPGTTMTDVLQYSLNTGVIYVLQQMGGGAINQKARQTLYAHYTGNYRFGNLTGIEQAGEAKGIVPGPDGGVGKNVDYATLTFGQGMNLTMIQTTAAFAAAMNGGTYYKPTLVEGTRQSDGSVRKQAPQIVAKNVLKPEVSNALRQMTYEARHKGFFGTSDPAGYTVGGKTGTSQIIDPKTGSYSNDNSIGSYLGFGGTDTPEYVIMVRVEDSKLTSGYAGTVAAGPIFNELSNWMLSYLELPPKQ